MEIQSEATQTCPRCGSTNMIRGLRMQTISYGGMTSPSYEQPGLWCQACGEGVISFPDEMEIGAREMRKLKAQVEDLVQPSEGQWENGSLRSE